jgi:hypothetical protein
MDGNRETAHPGLSDEYRDGLRDLGMPVRQVEALDARVAEARRTRIGAQEMCSYCLNRPATAETADGDPICDECSVPNYVTRIP